MDKMGKLLLAIYNCHILCFLIQIFCMLFSFHTFSAIKFKVKVGTEFSNVWGEYKNHSNPYIQGTTVPCDCCQVRTTPHVHVHVHVHVGTCIHYPVVYSQCYS